MSKAQANLPPHAQDGPLVVWMLTPATAADKLRLAQQKVASIPRLPQHSEEKMLNEFGTSSSNVGQTSGSYGQTAGSIGKNASDAGQTAASYGTTASGLGQTAGSAGQSASSYGQTAGSFGQMSSTFGQTLDGRNLTLASTTPRGTAQGREAARAGFLLAVGAEFPARDVRYATVIEEDLLDKLKATEGTVEYPDVVVGTALPVWWSGSGFGLAMLGGPSALEGNDDSTESRSRRTLQAGILVRAPHPAQARAFVVWLRDQNGCGLCDIAAVDKLLQAPAKIAEIALLNVLQGGTLAELADDDAAKYSAALAQRLALGSVSAEVVEGLQFRVDVMSAAANDRLSVVQMRAIATSERAFGVVHALVVLRKNAAGRWKVLQISPNMWPGAVGGGWNALHEYTTALTPKQVPKLVGISQAAPPDGDVRPVQPDLWWDNPGGSRLLVVEWQMKLGDWTDSRMMFVPDSNPRLQTRVNAKFARVGAEYRWRVWAMGAGGNVVLSPWKKLVIVQ